MKHPSLDVSIIIPFYNEEANVLSVIREVRETNPQAEIIAVDDGSSDATATKIMESGQARLLSLASNTGQSAALYAGIHAAARPICVLMDGDGQNDPADILAMSALLSPESVRLVCGFRQDRQDSWSRRMAGRIGNRIRRFFLHDDGILDTTCGLKAFYREDVHVLMPFNGLHRYIPVLFMNAGLPLVQMPVKHRQRLAGTSKYGITDRAWRGIFDLIGMKWLLARKIHMHKLRHA